MERITAMVDTKLKDKRNELSHFTTEIKTSNETTLFKITEALITCNKKIAHLENEDKRSYEDSLSELRAEIKTCHELSLSALIADLKTCTMKIMDLEKEFKRTSKSSLSTLSVNLKKFSEDAFFGLTAMLKLCNNQFSGYNVDLNSDNKNFCGLETEKNASKEKVFLDQDAEPRACNKKLSDMDIDHKASNWKNKLYLIVFTLFVCTKTYFFLSSNPTSLTVPDILSTIDHQKSKRKNENNGDYQRPKKRKTMSTTI